MLTGEDPVLPNAYDIEPLLFPLPVFQNSSIRKRETYCTNFVSHFEYHRITPTLCVCSILVYTITSV